MKTEMVEHEKEKQVAKVEPQPQPQPLSPSTGSTLLPTPIANIVSLATRSSSLYIRLGTFVGGLAIDGARVTTLTGLEMSRAVIESVLQRAGSDVSSRSTGELGRAEAEGILERSIATLHATITSLSFAASTGFYITTLAMESATDLSQQLLGTLDSMLGSTDSSREIASIITLIRREFQNPATGVEGEKVGVADLLVGICGLALLQRWCKKLTDFEDSEKNSEEVIFDVVVLDDGRRVDVFGETSDRQEVLMNSDAYLLPSNDLMEILETNGRSDLPREDMLEIDLKQKILQTLPPDAHISITTSTSTTKTITVEIAGTQPPNVSLPPGVEIIEEYADPKEVYENDILASTNELWRPKYRAVYQITRDNVMGNKIDTKTTLMNAGEIGGNGNAEDGPVGSSNSVRGPTFELTPLPSPEVDERKSLSSLPNMPSNGVLMTDTLQSGTSTIAQNVTSSSLATASTTLAPTANPKRLRQPLGSSSSSSENESRPRKLSGEITAMSKKSKLDKPPIKLFEDKGSFCNALKKGSSGTLSNLWNKDSTASPFVLSKKPSGRSHSGIQSPSTISKSSTIARDTTTVPAQQAPRTSQFSNAKPPSKELKNTPESSPRSSSRTSYYSLHERCHSVVSQTDTFSVHSVDGRPVSPGAIKNHMKQSSLIRTQSEKDITNRTSPSNSHHRRSSYVPSIYTLNTNNSATSLVVAAQFRQSAFDEMHSLDSLRRDGHVDGLFPQHHIIRNLTRFVRFASASYGASFLRVMGIGNAGAGKSKEFDTNHHHEHHSFSNHTQLPPSTILLSSFVDPQGGTDSTGHTGTGIPMVHFVSLDHDSKAVVLTCRGTLGFEDVLTDMTCDYDEIKYRNKAYKVHMGIHASARRLLSSRVFITIKAALEEFPEYGLVLCGHSLGGAVVSLLAVMISEPCTNSTEFVTSSASYERRQLLLPSHNNPGVGPEPTVHLSPGRPIHVYAYGPPATFSPSLRLATRGLITTVVNGQDLVPYLSLGILHDLQAVALAFKNDDSGAKGEVRKRVWEGLRGSFQDKWYRSSTGPPQREEDDQWAYASLKTLRASMLSSKLVPPGELFIVESMPVLRRDGFVKEGQSLGKPATRSVLRYVRDVEKRFGEVRFGGSMLLDHSPGRYEASLGALGKGVPGLP